MSAKLILLIILSFITSFSFIGAGLYFMSNKFIAKVNDSSPDNSEQNLRKNTFRAKGSGYVAISIGALTFIWAIMLIMIPPMAPLLSLVYMIILVFAFAALVVIYK